MKESTKALLCTVLMFVLVGVADRQQIDFNDSLDATQVISWP